jgi:sugar/nucleoside kinase (ribokinase family)
VSPNEAELIAMSMGTDYNLNSILNQSDHDNDLHSFIHQLEPCVLELLQQGIDYVVLTLGKHGVILCSKKPCHINNKEEKTGGSSNACYYHFPALKATTIVSLSGAGDCFVGGALTGLCLYKDLWSSIAFGIAVANRAIQSELNVPSSLRLTQEDLSGKHQRLL